MLRFIDLLKTILLAILCVALLLNLISFSGIDSTIKENNAIFQQFQETEKSVKHFYGKHNRLPTNKELRDLGNSYTNLVRLTRTKFLKRRFGRVPENEFILGYYSIEHPVDEYYASWNGDSTLTLDRQEYFCFGIPGLCSLIAILLFIVLRSLLNSVTRKLSEYSSVAEGN